MSIFVLMEAALWGLVQQNRCKNGIKVTVYINRMRNGNTSNLKSIGDGVHECRIDWGAGYRVYLGKDGENLVILLGGGTKRRQQDDIDRAKELWKAYKRKKREKEKK